MKSDADRLAGYKAALAEADIQFRPEFVAYGDGKPPGGVQAMRKLLSLPQRATAVFCYNDMSAIGALQAAAICGVHVPQEMSLVGFDDLFVAPYLQPPLTTIRQPMRKMGKLAMNVLLSLLAGEKTDQMIFVAGRLVVRASTAPPPA
jgi:DNA-binding LacI/PurR family transcriptional regulator